MKYITVIASLTLATLLSGCMMMGGMGGSDDGSGSSSSGMMKCGMMMGGMDHSSKDVKHDSTDMNHDSKEMDQKSMDSSSSSMKCGGSMKMDGNKDMKYSENGENLSKSYVIAEKYCTQCHTMRKSSLYSKDEWKPILARMMGYMQKTQKPLPDSYEKVMIEHYYGLD